MPMAAWPDYVIFALVWMLPFLGVALALLYGGYVAYETRLKREALARERAANPPGPDPVLELARVNDQIERELAEARQVLATARDTIRRGTKG